MIGNVIDESYEVLEQIGEGAYGTVYRCNEKSLDRTVAVKVLSGARKTQSDMEKFLQEGKILGAVSHPNVVPIHRLGFHEQLPYIVMSYLEGNTLRDLIRKNPLPMKAGLSIMKQVAAGLAAIHQSGIVHRDMSWNNVMVTNSNQAIILDFGIAKSMNDFTGTTAEGYLKGTIGYLAPEQIDGKGASISSDVFAFGVLLFQALTGNHPFQAEHHMSLLYNIAHKRPTPLNTFLASPPKALEDLIEKCLAKDPQARVRDMNKVEAALASILDEQALAGEAAATSTMEIRLAPNNPYLNRVMIHRWRDFFGRKQEVRRIFARFNATPPGSVSIVGDRKIGKSSLLNYVYMRRNRNAYLEEPDKMVMVFLDFQEERSMSIKAFVTTLLTMAQLELRDNLSVADCSKDLDGIKDMVERLHTNGYRLVILLDEFDCITTNSNFDLQFFAFLRHLANRYNVAYLTSSARNLQVLCHNKDIADSPFFNIFSMMRLSVFKREEAEELIQEPSERAGRPLASYTDQILEMAGLFPFFIQIACSHALEYLEEHPDADAPDFQEVKRRFYEEAKLHYRFMWENFDDHEKSAVRRVSKKKSIPDSLKHVLQELEGRHLVEMEDSKARLFSNVFDEFVKLEGAREKGSLLDRLLGRS